MKKLPRCLSTSYLAVKTIWDLKIHFPYRFNSLFKATYVLAFFHWKLIYFPGPPAQLQNQHFSIFFKNLKCHIKKFHSVLFSYCTFILNIFLKYCFIFKLFKHYFKLFVFAFFVCNFYLLKMFKPFWFWYFKKINN